MLVDVTVSESRDGTRQIFDPCKVPEIFNVHNAFHEILLNSEPINSGNNSRSTHRTRLCAS